ncbi:hypothetical protein NL676_028225 [Syzygium grande]|nr:hypothetical protein NL676_028225 [Syzygium grande]
MCSPLRCSNSGLASSMTLVEWSFAVDGPQAGRSEASDVERSSDVMEEDRDARQRLGLLPSADVLEILKWRAALFLSLHVFLP